MPDTFTPEQISQILEEFFRVVGTRQYIGARYVPIFGRKGETSIEWDNTAPYEPLTIVLYQGNSYTSRQYVPVGVEITNQEFWAVTGNYNAQIEVYRRDTAAALATAEDAQESANNAQNDIDTLLPKSNFSAQNTVKKYVDDSIATVQNDIDTLLPKSAFSSSNTVKNYIDASAATLNDNIETASDAITDIIGTRFTDTNTITAFANSIDDKLSTYQTKMLVIGDSYSDHELSGDQAHDSSLWWYHVAQALNLTPTKYAKSGAGYVHASDGITFDTLATNAIAAITDKELYRYVFVYGGLNDLRLDVSRNDFQTAVANLLLKLRGAFPHSTVVVMGCNTFINQNINANNDTQTSFSNIIARVAFAAECAFINTNTWLLGWASQFNSAEHPNQSGESRIAGLVLSALFGTNSSTGAVDDFTNPNNWTVINANRLQSSSSILTPTAMYINLALELTSQPSESAIPGIRLPWNLSSAVTINNSFTVAPITMRIGGTFYNNIYAIINKNAIDFHSQQWPELSSTGYIYLNIVLPM